MNDKQENDTLPQRAANTLRNLGGLRDGFLVTAAIFYFAGYVVWAINAYRNNLGLLPALELQYLVAGAPPVFIILAICFLVVAAKRLSDRVRKNIGDNPTGHKLRLCRVMFYLTIGAGIAVVIPSTDWYKATFPAFVNGTWLALISMLIIVSSYPFLRQLTTIENVPENKGLRLLTNSSRLFLSFWLSWLAIVYAVMFLLGATAIALYYGIALYPTLPQEFGGLRPYCARLDVVKAQISNETIQGILPIDADKLNEPVVRSATVEVLFSGNDVVLVRSQGKVYRIAKGTIQTVTICSEEESVGTPP